MRKLLLNTVLEDRVKMKDFSVSYGGYGIGYIMKSTKIESKEGLFYLNYWLDRQAVSGELVLCLDITGENLSSPYFIDEFEIGDNEDNLEDVAHLIIEENFDDDDFESLII